MFNSYASTVTIDGPADQTLTDAIFEHLRSMPDDPMLITASPDSGALQVLTDQLNGYALTHTVVDPTRPLLGLEVALGGTTATLTTPRTLVHTDAAVLVFVTSGDGPNPTHAKESRELHANSAQYVTFVIHTP